MIYWSLGNRIPEWLLCLFATMFFSTLATWSLGDDAYVSDLILALHLSPLVPWDLLASLAPAFMNILFSSFGTSCSGRGCIFCYPFYLERKYYIVPPLVPRRQSTTPRRARS